MNASSLFGLAPGGVYLAINVTIDAVRSYRTLSPLPGRRSARAVCFLWHFPWGRPRRALPGTVFPWSPDFPLFGPKAEQRSSDRLAVGVITYVRALRKGLTGRKVGEL